MTTTAYNTDNINVRLAKNAEEIEQAQRLRYKVFYEEHGAQADEKTAAEKRDSDHYDEYADHLIVEDTGIDDKNSRIVGTYRLLRYEKAMENGQFYTSDEYDIQNLMSFGDGLLELGRSCVLPDYRTKPVLKILWAGIAHYVADNDIDLMFGCASLHGTDTDALSEQLAYLHHYHLADQKLQTRAVPERYVDMNLHAKNYIDARKVFASLPPLVKGYLRLGASIGDGAVIDAQFNTTDVCIILPTNEVTEKYLRHYERVTNKTIPTDSKTSVETKECAT